MVLPGCTSILADALARELQIGGLHGGVGLRGAGVQFRLLGFVIGNAPFLVEAGVAFGIAAGFFGDGFRALQLRFRHGDLRFGGGEHFAGNDDIVGDLDGVDREEARDARLHGVAQIDIHGEQGSFDAGGNDGRVYGFQRALYAHGADEGAGCGGLGAHGQPIVGERGLRGVGIRLFGAAADQPERAEGCGQRKKRENRFHG